MEDSKRRSRAIFVRTVELIVVVLSFLGSSAIARFLVAKITLDTIVWVTSTFGPGVGHTLSSFLAAIVAEPRIIAFIVAGIFFLIHLIGGFIRLLVPRRPHHHHGPHGAHGPR